MNISILKPKTLLTLNWVSVFFWSVFLGVSSVFFYEILVLPLLILFILLIVKSSFIRFLYVVTGSLFIFQSSSGLGTLKLIFLSGLLLISIVSMYNVNLIIKDEKIKYIKNIIYASFVYIIYLMFNTFYSMLSGVDLFTAIRENSPYFIFAIMPILSLDFALNSKKKNIKIVLLASGIYATVACIISWYQRRYFLESADITSIGFASYMLAYGFFALACTNALKLKKNNIYWSVICGLTLSGLALTGTRTTFFVLPMVFLITAFIGKQFSFTYKLYRSISVLFYISLFTILSSFVLLNVTNFDKNIFYDRIKLSLVVFNQSSSSDLSISGRISQSEAALEAIKDSPLLGKGGGHVFESKNYLGQPEYRTSIDTPLSIVAKQGIIGTLLFLIILFFIYLYLKKLDDKEKNKLSTYYLSSYLSCAAITMLILSIGEDKGFSLAMVLFLTYSFCDLLEKSSLDQNLQPYKNYV